MKLVSVAAIVALVCVLFALAAADEFDYYDYNDYADDYAVEFDESPDFDLDNDFSAALAATPIKGCNVVNKTPYYNQPNGYTCGATSLRMVLGAAGVSKTINEICTAMGSCPTNGVGHDQILRAAKKFGFSKAHVEYGWDKLEAAIAAGKTVVAHLHVAAGGAPRFCSSGTSAYRKTTGGHYVQVYGLTCNDAKSSVTCVNTNDPANKTLQRVKYSKASFEEAWAKKSRAFIVLK